MQKFQKGDVVHMDFNHPFKDRNGIIVDVVERNEQRKYRYKYLVEVEYKTSFTKRIKIQRMWFTGEQFLCKKL